MMRAFQVKNTVNAEKVDQHVWFALGYAAALHNRLTGRPLVVTSLRDSLHNDFSLHYNGLACDLRLHDLNPVEKTDFYSQLKAGLDPLGFDTLLEAMGSPNEHVHIEWDPKPGEEFLSVLA